MKFGTFMLAGAALAALSGAVAAQNAGAPPAPPAGQRPPGPPPTAALGDGPWEVVSSDARLKVEVLTKGLDHPWGMAFLPGGDILVTERPGRLRLVRGGQLVPEPIGGLPPIFAPGIAGLTDIALDPDFARNGLIYLAYSKADPEAGENPRPNTDSTLAVLRARYDGSPSLKEVEEIFVGDTWYGGTAVQRCCGQGPAFGSYGGRMAFGPDGYLYLTSGDRNYGEMVQKGDNHFGKVLRLTKDGKPAPGNPFEGRAGWEPEIWSTGHRNPTGLAFDPETGTLWETEFGPRGGDEVNRIEKGANYGWPDVTQGYHYDGTPPAKGIRGVAGMTDPVWAFGPPSNNPGNIAVYRGDLFPTWNGDLLIAMMNRTLVRLELGTEGHVVAKEEMLGNLGQRLRDVRVGPDGAVYLLTDETAGAILKLTPAPEPARPQPPR